MTVPAGPLRPVDQAVSRHPRSRPRPAARAAAWLASSTAPASHHQRVHGRDSPCHRRPRGLGPHGRAPAVRAARTRAPHQSRQEIAAPHGPDSSGLADTGRLQTRREGRDHLRGLRGYVGGGEAELLHHHLIRAARKRFSMPAAPKAPRCTSPSPVHRLVGGPILAHADGIVVNTYVTGKWLMAAERIDGRCNPKTRRTSRQRAHPAVTASCRWRWRPWRAREHRSGRCGRSRPGAAHRTLRVRRDVARVLQVAGAVQPGEGRRIRDRQRRPAARAPGRPVPARRFGRLARGDALGVSGEGGQRGLPPSASVPAVTRRNSAAGSGTRPAYRPMPACQSACHCRPRGNAWPKRRCASSGIRNAGSVGQPRLRSWPAQPRPRPGARRGPRRSPACWARRNRSWFARS